MNTMFRNFTHISIPAEIWLQKDISIQAKVLWAEMRSLHDNSKGGCFASDEYLMQFMQLQRRRLYELYKELKDKKLLETVFFDGRNTIRRAIVPEVVYKNNFLHEPVHSSCAEKCTPEVQDPALTPYIENKDLENNIISPTSLTPAVPKNESAIEIPKPKNQKPAKKEPAYSPEVKAAGEKIIATLREEKPDLVIRLTPTFLDPVRKMLEEDGRRLEKMILCLRWAMKDDKFWRKWVFKKEVSRYLHKNFDAWDIERQIKPSRKFAPCSDDEEAFKTLSKIRRIADED